MKKILSLLLVFCIGTAFGYCVFSIQSKAVQNNFDQENIFSTESTQLPTETEYIEISLSNEIADFPYTLQTPELPTGCEITALTMVLNYYGYSVDKTTMATVYLPTAPDDMYYDEYGVMHGADLNDYFISDPESVYFSRGSHGVILE